MKEVTLISEVHVGNTLDGKRKAILFVDEKIVNTPGQLGALTEFLRAGGLVATPGYEGGHVLRVSNFESDETLHTLLEKEFPEWLKTHKPDWPKNQKLLDTAAPFIPLDRGERKPFQLARFVRQYATPLVGALSFLSGASIMVIDLKNLRAHKGSKIENIKSSISTAGTSFFLVASTLLGGFGWAAARKPSVTELMRSFEPQLNQDPSTLTLNGKHSLLKRDLNYALNNPWRIATLANVFGVIIKSVGHAIPSNKTTRNPFTMKISTRPDIVDRPELFALGGSLISHGLIATANPEESNTILGIKSYEKSLLASDPLERHYHPFSQSILSPFDPANDQGKGGHLNMKAAGYLAMVGTLGFGGKGVADTLAGLRASDDIALKARKNWPLMLLFPLNLTADYITTLSKPRTTYSVDELATTAADYIAHKLDMKKASPEEVTREAYILSELFANHPRVTQSARQLRKAIDARLEFDHGYKLPTQDDEALKEYQYMMSISPFAELPKTAAVAAVSSTPAAQSPVAVPSVPSAMPSPASPTASPTQGGTSAAPVLPQTPIQPPAPQPVMHAAPPASSPPVQAMSPAPAVDHSPAPPKLTQDNIPVAVRQDNTPAAAKPGVITVTAKTEPTAKNFVDRVQQPEMESVTAVR